MYDSGEFSKNVTNGSFKNIYPGNYIVKTKTIDGVTYTDSIDIVVSLDPYYGKFDGSAILKTHHVGIIPYTHLGYSVMNTTNTAVGGYYYSYLRNTTLPKYLTGYKNAYGANHFLTFGELISNAIDGNAAAFTHVSTGRSKSWGWYKTQITTMSEIQVCGSMTYSCGVDVGEANNQLAAFRIDHTLQNYQNGSFWLRGVAGMEEFSMSHGYGFIGCNVASTSYGVCPLLLLY